MSFPWNDLCKWIWMSWMVAVSPNAQTVKYNTVLWTKSPFDILKTVFSPSVPTLWRCYILICNDDSIENQTEQIVLIVPFTHLPSMEIMFLDEEWQTHRKECTWQRNWISSNRLQFNISSTQFKTERYEILVNY